MGEKKHVTFNRNANLQMVCLIRNEKVNVKEKNLIKVNSIFCKNVPNLQKNFKKYSDMNVCMSYMHEKKGNSLTWKLNVNVQKNVQKATTVGVELNLVP